LTDLKFVSYFMTLQAPGTMADRHHTPCPEFRPSALAAYPE
jgi:hypothetical protein